MMTRPTAIAGKARSVRFNEMIWPVTVVPISAPSTTPTACVSVMRPAFTKPTVMTVQALDDWIRAVTTAPTVTAMKRFLVNIFSIHLSFSPATR